MGNLSLLQGIFLIQGLNPDLLHCRQILCQLSHRGSPGILEWIASPSPVDLSDPGIEPGSPALQADSLPTELSGKPPVKLKHCLFLPTKSGPFVHALSSEEMTSSCPTLLFYFDAELSLTFQVLALVRSSLNLISSRESLVS